MWSHGLRRKVMDHLDIVPRYLLYTRCRTQLFNMLVLEFPGNDCSSARSRERIDGIRDI
jgi:hypothetical protein